MFENKNIVLIGGGTGSSVLLRELKHYTQNITAIVNVCDDGGSSGKLRREYDVLSPGDIRNCIVALADEESTLAQLMNYRFTDGFMRRQSLGNIMLTGLNYISGSFPLAIKNMSDVLAISGRVIPVTVQSIELFAEMDNGRVVRGESYIPRYAMRSKTHIRRVFIRPENAYAYGECLQAIELADIIIYCPGSLYTSLIPNLLVGGICEALEKSRAHKYWVMNLMTQKGETIGMSLSRHIEALENHSGSARIVDTIIYNTEPISEPIRLAYLTEEAELLSADTAAEACSRYELIGLPLINIVEGKVRHNSRAALEYIGKREKNENRQAD